MNIKRFESFGNESNKTEMSRKIDKMVQEGRSSIDIIDLITDEIMADVKNKLGPVATLIDLVAISNDKESKDSSKDYANSRIPEQLIRSYKAIEYLKNYNFDNKYKDM